ncbi:MAG: tRNA epoxyqueuosine(34) reductase QueG [Planctomycetota bacterium]
MNIKPSIVRELAEAAGFDLVGFGPADPGDQAQRFEDWLDEGRAGEMSYLHRNRERISDPQSWVPGARSAISLAFEYGSGEARIEGGARVARYAVGRDYHRVLGKRTRWLREKLEEEGIERGEIKVGTDAVPILERALAAQAGIGFLAKSSGIISAQKGPYLLLSELLTPLELPIDLPSPGSCGTCTRCLEACPTGAITAPFQVDARRCISYTTIELRGSIPVELRAPQGDWLFGCDICLEVCPFTSKSSRGSNSGEGLPSELQRHPALDAYSVIGILELSAAEYEEHWTGTAMRRATRQGLRRNAAVVLGNSGDLANLPALCRSLDDPDPVLREHAAWAIGRIDPDCKALDDRLGREEDPAVRSAIRDALAKS